MRFTVHVIDRNTGKADTLDYETEDERAAIEAACNDGYVVEKIKASTDRPPLFTPENKTGQKPPPPGSVNMFGPWCSHCGNRHAYLRVENLWAFYTLIVLGLLMVLAVGVIPLALPIYIAIAIMTRALLPRTWCCQLCRHQWRA